MDENKDMNIVNGMNGAGASGTAGSATLPAGTYGAKSIYADAHVKEGAPFAAGRAEMIFAGLSFIAAYCYILLFWNMMDAPGSAGAEISRSVWTVRLSLLAVAAFIVAAGFALWGKAGSEDVDAGFALGGKAGSENGSEDVAAGGTAGLTLKRPSAPENYVWLGCFICCLAGFLLHYVPSVMSGEDPVEGYGAIVLWRGGVWDPGQILLFIHIFAVWWLLSESGVLLEGKSGHLLPVDALNGLAIIPFANFFLRVRTCAFALKKIFGREGAEKKRGFSFKSAAALIICGCLLVSAVSLLGSADSNFAGLIDGIRGSLSFDIDGDFVLRLILSIPVGAWLFGLAAGCARRSREDLDRQRGSVMTALASMRGVSARLWTAVVCVFSLVYAVFFVLQASYLFGGFTGRLPEGFIYSQYAREGFFELCRVMLVNFALLWLVTRMAAAGEAGGRTLKALCLTVLAESVLFALVALSKLALYISVYGFTPLRLQSSWLVCVLLAGCLLWARSILTDRPAFRKWMYFGAVSLSLLALY